MGIEGVVNVLVQLFTGPMARGITIISLAFLGFRWMAGGHDVTRASVNWAIGATIIFGGGSIVGLFI